MQQSTAGLASFTWVCRWGKGTQVERWYGVEWLGGGAQGMSLGELDALIKQHTSPKLVQSQG
ncbi:hypothetical protein HYPGJ_31436 [Hyphomicrobium sp. GJ21]|nr:hypothetical protein HYPGJ_31436 [Hyphomicrobium sp. GJ21]